METPAEPSTDFPRLQAALKRFERAVIIAHTPFDNSANEAATRTPALATSVLAACQAPTWDAVGVYGRLSVAARGRTNEGEEQFGLSDILAPDESDEATVIIDRRHTRAMFIEDRSDVRQRQAGGHARTRGHECRHRMVTGSLRQLGLAAIGSGVLG
jgi:hypothetical protein